MRRNMTVAGEEALDLPGLLAVCWCFVDSAWSCFFSEISQYLLFKSAMKLSSSNYVI